MPKNIHINTYSEWFFSFMSSWAVDFSSGNWTAAKHKYGTVLYREMESHNKLGWWDCFGRELVCPIQCWLASWTIHRNFPLLRGGNSYSWSVIASTNVELFLLLSSALAVSWLLVKKASSLAITLDQIWVKHKKFTCEYHGESSKRLGHQNLRPESQLN